MQPVIGALAKRFGSLGLPFAGILDDDMSTYLDGQANAALAFDTLDFLVANGITPTVELSFMPEGLASNASQTVFHYKGGIVSA